jgi:hypothetical protein
MSESTGRPLPQCKAILLCEKPLFDPATRRTSLIGIIEDVRLPDLPERMPPFTAFLQLTGGVGRYDVAAELHDLQRDIVLARSPAVTIEWEDEDRLSKMNLFLSVPSLMMAFDGDYDLIVLADGEEIDRQRFTVLEDRAT